MARGDRLAAMLPADSAGEPILMDGPSLLDSVTVELGEEPDVSVDGAVLTELEDGGVSIDLNPTPASAEPMPFDGNLATVMLQSDCSALATELIDAVHDDIKSREDWETTMMLGIELLGLKIEDKTEPFVGAAGVYDPILAEAVIRWQATATGELLPASGPVKTKIYGLVTTALESQGQRVRDWMNLYLTELAPEYYDEADRMYFWLPLVGSTFKKVYQDPILRRPVARFVTPDKFVVAYGATDLETCPRYTHITEVSEKEMKSNVASGFWRECNVGDGIKLGDDRSNLTKTTDDVLGLKPVIARNDRMYDIYEVHADLVLKGFEDDSSPKGIPLPYIVTIEKQTREVLSIRRNWREADEKKAKRVYFVHYTFIPGIGFYGVGYAHLIGGSAKAATTARRQLLDSGTLNNFPGGLRVKGMKFADNNISIGPMEFAEVDTGGLPIQNAIMTMPYKEPSVVLLELLKETNEGARNLANTSEIAVGDGRQDAPVGTTVALLEAATKVQSATIKRQHRSAAKEYKLIAELFGEYLPDEPYPFPVVGGQSAIMRSDFSDNIDVIPVSDPNINSSAQRLMMAQAALQGAQAAPQLHDLRVAYRNFYISMGMDEERIAAMMPQPEEAQPLDPLSENMNALMGKPVRASIEQDHDAHIAAHMAVVQQVPTMQAHIAEHVALKMRVAVERITGPLPPPGQKLPPEVENQIAVAVAEALEQVKAQRMAENGGLPDDPAMAMVFTEKQKNDQKFNIDQQKIAQKDREIAIDAQNDAADRANDLQIEAMRQRGDAAERGRALPPSVDSNLRKG